MYQRKDGRWQEKVVIGDKRYTFTAPTKKELKLKMTQFEEKVELSTLFSSVLDAWEEDHFARVEAGTQMCYRPALKRAHSEFGRVHTNQITPRQIDLSMRRMAAQGYAYQTVKIYLSTLRQAFDFAVLHGDIDINPTEAVHVPKHLPRKQRELPDDLSIKRIVDHVEDPFGLFAYLLLYTGLRRGEALALQWRDIDFKAHVIRVYKSIHFDGDRPQIKSTKTAAGCREVILLDALADQLHPSKPCDYIFGGANPLTQKEYRKRYYAYALAAGIAREEIKPDVRTRRGKIEQYDRKTVIHIITPHQLRHAYATMLYEADIADKDAQALLGHTKISVTRDIYTHIRKKRMTSAAKKLNEKIDPSTGTVKIEDAE